MKIEDLHLLLKSSFVQKMLPLISAGTMLFTLYYIFMVVPNEQVMGAVQRIFYFHVGSALTVYLMIAVLFISSSFYLNSKIAEWDYLAESAASLAFVFSTIVLATGMIWGHSAWNVWWRWEPRLVSFLVLWLILFSYIILRSFMAGDAKEKTFAAILGVIAAINVPVVIFSIKLLSHREQLHPEVVGKQGLADPRFGTGLLLAVCALFLFSILLLCLKVVQRMQEARLRNLELR